MSFLRKCLFYLLCGLGFFASSIYVWSYLAQSQNSLRTVVFGFFLIVVMFAMISWKWAVMTFIFCLPLFNTLPAVLGLSNIWPPFNFNLLYLTGLTTAFFIYTITGHSLNAKDRSNKGLIATPYDSLWALFIILVFLGMLVGACRYENIFCPGFIRELPGKLTRIPFSSQTDNTLCYTRAMQFVFMALAFYFAVSVFRTRKDIYRALYLLLGSSVLVGSFGVWQHKTGKFLVGIQTVFKRINATYNGPDSAATYFLCMMILAFACLFFAKKIYQYLMLIFVIALSGVCLYLTETRTAMYAMALAIFITLSLAIVRSKKLLKPLPYVLIVCGVLLFFGAGNKMTLPGRYIAKNLKEQRVFQGLDKLEIDPRRLDEWLSFRSYHWYAARAAVKEAPVLGHGLGTLDKLYKKYRSQRDRYTSAFAHNLYLDYWSELGLPGFVLSLSFFILSFFLAWRLWSNPCGGRHVRSLALALLAIQLSLAIGNIFSSSLYYVTELMFLQSVFLAMLSSLFVSVYASGDLSLRRKAESFFNALRTEPAYRRVFLAAAVVVMGLFLYKSYRAAQKGRDQYYSCEPYNNSGQILEYGIEHYEFDMHSNKFARTRRRVYRPIMTNSRYLQIYLRASHPDAEAKPVPATFVINGKLAGACVLSNRNWNAYTIDISRIVPILTNENFTTGGKKIPVELEFISGRMWNPLDWNPQEQNIKYGIDLGTILQGLF